MRRIFVLFMLIFVVMEGFAQQRGSIKIRKVTTATLTITDTVMKFDSDYYYYSEGGTMAPEFPGGKKAETKFINTTRVIPDCIKCKGYSYATDLSVIVRNDGRLDSVKVKYGIVDCPKCDEEAMRVVKSMPKWNPAIVNGVPTDMKWEISVSFTYGK